MLSPSKPAILMIDDEAEDLRYHRSMIAAHFNEVSIDLAQNLRQAREFLREKKYDLIVCDGNLDTFTGPELLCHLRELPEDDVMHQNARTPFILLTSDLGMNEDSSPLADAVIKKGKDVSLMAAVQKTLQLGMA